ncbi:hypothetical protein HLRTI_002922 [Halorhabdus tiamatea SARL4B]|uniref:Uncharacterized protein n=1 Tax=Halorhabdus tiamatea SARL4B TaxID=1033806 RepID=U2DY73_9EURY|nr:hypothetical protein [Halorhabdus tiamatea]ERJ05123.1 hypothetical protein HLRTI_002922 [Halorhabdus tiamatea SARL4B]
MSEEYNSENPIENWIVEIVPIHGGGVSKEDRLDQIEELVDRLSESTSLSMLESLNTAAETYDTHKRMVESAAFEGDISDVEERALMDAFERLLIRWVDTPHEIESEMEEYKNELEYIHEE